MYYTKQLVLSAVHILTNTAAQEDNTTSANLRYALQQALSPVQFLLDTAAQEDSITSAIWHAVAGNYLSHSMSTYLVLLHMTPGHATTRALLPGSLVRKAR